MQKQQKMKWCFYALLILVLCAAFASSYAQSIGIGTSNPDNSAILELNSNSKGLLLPRLTNSQRNNINNPAQGLLIFQKDLDSGFYYYTGFVWKKLESQINQSQNSSNIFVFMKKYEDSPLPEEIWVANHDGSGAHKINIPDTLKISDDACLSTDGSLIFFNAFDSVGKRETSIYACNVDGSNLRRVAKAEIGYDYEVRTAAGGLSSQLSLDTSYVFFSRETVPDVDEIWRINFDGTNELKLNISLPGDYKLEVSNDGGQLAVNKSTSRIVFKARSNVLGYSSLFSCKFDGSNVTKIVDRVTTSFTVN